MCLICYQSLDLRHLIDQVNELKDIDETYDFTKWNTTSLSFVLLFISDNRLVCYHSIIERLYEIISKQNTSVLREKPTSGHFNEVSVLVRSNPILDSINSNSFDNTAYEIFDAIRNALKQTGEKM